MSIEAAESRGRRRLVTICCCPAAGRAAAAEDRERQWQDQPPTVGEQADQQQGQTTEPQIPAAAEAGVFTIHGSQDKTEAQEDQALFVSDIFVAQ